MEETMQLTKAIGRQESQAWKAEIKGQWEQQQSQDHTMQ